MNASSPDVGSSRRTISAIERKNMHYCTSVPEGGGENAFAFPKCMPSLKPPSKQIIHISRATFGSILKISLLGLSMCQRNSVVIAYNVSM